MFVGSELDQQCLESNPKQCWMKHVISNCDALIPILVQGKYIYDSQVSSLVSQHLVSHWIGPAAWTKVYGSNDVDGR